ncbi:MAG: rhodanese-like domain-containing protein [Chitinophagaceae bacterium]
MLHTIKSLFKKRPESDFAKLIKDGAIILDVRTKSEFEGGHVRGAINIPVDQLRNNLSKLKDKNGTVITCCASGIRSGSAKAILNSCGYTNVLDGGGWKGLANKLQ